MGSSNFANTILGEATHKAVDDTGANWTKRPTKFLTHVLASMALVADATGNTLIMNVGKKAGVKDWRQADRFSPGARG